MMIDLSKRDNISDDEHAKIVTVLQVAILGEFVRAEHWRAGNVAFHGGSAIRSAYSSLRYSEDIDFMVSKRVRETLSQLATLVHGVVKSKFDTLTPGAKIGFATKSGKEGADDIIDAWQVKWSHDKRIGKVMVKVEFYVVPEDSMLLDGYQVRISELTLNGTPVSGRLPVGTAVSLWADKLKAMATRPEIKWRDVHDIAYLLGLTDVRRSDDAEQMRALEVTASIYRKTLTDIRDGLKVRLDSGKLDLENEFIADMSKWFTGSVHTLNIKTGTYGQMLADTKREMERVVLALEDTLGCDGGVRP